MILRNIAVGGVKVRSVSVLLVLAVLTILGPTLGATRSGTTAPAEQFRELAQQLSSQPPDDCAPVARLDASVQSADRIGNKLFKAASEVVLQALRAHPTAPLNAVTSTLNNLRSISQDTFVSWPEDERFKFHVLDISPALVVELSIRTQATFSTFIHGPVIGNDVPGGEAKEHTWNFEGMGSSEWHNDAREEQLDLYALPRGPSRTPRFLSVMHQSWCAGPGITLNTAYEWRKLNYGSPEKFSFHRIKILDRQSTDPDKAPPWLKFCLADDRLSIPYCWDGVVNLGSVWPAICSMETYDLSGDIVQLIGRKTDRPDLAAVLHVFEYARNNDLRAIEAYCISPAVAEHILRLLPPSSYFVGAFTKRISPDREIIEMGDDWDLKFTLERVHGKWMVSAFELDN